MLATPAHLLAVNDGYYPKTPDYHGWFESQVSKHTLWDSTNGGPEGYHVMNNFFNIDLSIIGQDAQNIIPLPPYICALTVASLSIEKSYGHLDDGGLFIEKDNPEQECLLKFGTSSYWEWGAPGKERNNNNDIIPGGITYKQYYDKVEYLLNLAIYYTASALMWSMKKVKKDSSPEYDQWAKVFYKDKNPDEERPVENPADLDIDDESNWIREFTKKYKPNLLITLSLMAPILGLVFIPKILSILKEKALEQTP